jgi:hypothetical protein
MPGGRTSAPGHKPINPTPTNSTTTKNATHTAATTHHGHHALDARPRAPAPAIRSAPANAAPTVTAA